MKHGAQAELLETLKLLAEQGGPQLEVPEHIADFHKPAGHRCPHQRFNVGCAMYRKRPLGCRFWVCAWLEGEDLPRPDHAGFVVDTVADEIKIGHPDGSEELLPVIQVWVDKRRRTAYRDPRLLKWLESKCREHNCAVIVRYDETDAFTMFLTADGWLERHDGHVERDADFGIHGARKKAMPIARGEEHDR